MFLFDDVIMQFIVAMWRHVGTYIWVNIGSVIGLVPDAKLQRDLSNKNMIFNS